MSAAKFGPVTTKVAPATRDSRVTVGFMIAKLLSCAATRPEDDGSVRQPPSLIFSSVTRSPAIAPVMIATASDIVNSCGLMTATRRPSR